MSWGGGGHDKQDRESFLVPSCGFLPVGQGSRLGRRPLMFVLFSMSEFPSEDRATLGEE